MKRALYLDRDGVINIEKAYLYKIEDFEFIKGIIDLCKYYQNLGFIIIVVTNQSGIDREYYSEEDFSVLTAYMTEQFLSHGVKITHVYHCPHHENISGKCECRKPAPGMLLQAKKDYDIDLLNSIIIGDKERDVEAGLNAGLHETYLFDELKTTNESKATKIVDKLDQIWKI
ncbi:HAD family hydrolase [Sulfurimonas sp. SAG-AH-194-C21]|nr:HAD family hydrolase [Sulfurimonas sp. SAG-AH-194-C21]MDF1884209.1 HAD family hydrolase [Sulfurimonas sp. SAG-AH-194-C21]